MSYLLDTHTYIWWLGDPDRVGAAATSVLSEASNQVFVSVASIWEIAIKSSLGKLTLSEDVQSLAHSLDEDGFKLLGIVPHHCGAVSALPFHHRDPFDRMLVAQALCENLILLSRDGALCSYPIEVVW